MTQSPGPDWDNAFAGRLAPGNAPALLLVDPVRAYVEHGSPLFLDSGAAALACMASEANSKLNEKDRHSF